MTTIDARLDLRIQGLAEFIQINMDVVELPAFYPFGEDTVNERGLPPDSPPAAEGSGPAD